LWDDDNALSSCCEDEKIVAAQLLLSGRSKQGESGVEFGIVIRVTFTKYFSIQINANLEWYCFLKQQ
jgi:hypothetical protein